MPEIWGKSPSFLIRGRCRRPGWARFAGSILVGFQLAAASVVLANDWSLSPYLQAATGHESALLLDPGGAALVVPGGVFFDLAPTITLQRKLDERRFLQFGTTARIERFFNDVNRTLYAQSVWGDYLLRLGEPTRLRVSLNGNYFNDTEQSALRRFQAGGELGLGYLRRSWSLEPYLGAHAVAYPRAESFDASGRPIDYRETRWTAGLEAALRPVSVLRFGLNGLYRVTDSVLSDFDSRSWLSELTLRWTPARSWRFDAFYGFQIRRFDTREAGLDEDEYQQWGIGLAYRLGRDLELRLRWAAGRYLSTSGQDEPTDRFEFSINLGPAVFGIEEDLDLLLDTAAFPELTAGLDPRGILFRIHAPGAVRVAVVGDFNGWDSDQNLLGPGEDGWWEVWIPLDAGSYQYVYLIDGEARIPPESKTTVDDGFGGRNGLIQVLSPIP